MTKKKEPKPRRYRKNVQLTDEAHEQLRTLAAAHPLVEAGVDGKPRLSGKVGTSMNAMCGLCIAWAAKAVRDAEMRPGR